jgi:hypothetical protein
VLSPYFLGSIEKFFFSSVMVQDILIQEYFHKKFCGFYTFKTQRHTSKRFYIIINSFNLHAHLKKLFITQESIDFKLLKSMKTFQISHNLFLADKPSLIFLFEL